MPKMNHPPGRRIVHTNYISDRCGLHCIVGVRNGDRCAYVYDESYDRTKDQLMQQMTCGVICVYIALFCMLSAQCMASITDRRSHDFRHV